jgi:hypothetical protein
LLGDGQKSQKYAAGMGAPLGEAGEVLELQSGCGQEQEVALRALLGATWALVVAADVLEAKAGTMAPLSASRVVLGEHL